MSMETRRHHPISQLPEVSALFRLYNELEEQTSAFKSAAGIACPDGCGSCCDTPSTNIEASAFELVPFAMDQWIGAQAERMLDLAGMLSATDA